MRRVVPVVLLVGCSSEGSFVNQTQTDVFEQTPPDSVDILFVIDDSNSMEEEQRALIAGFGTFIGQIEEANSGFHLGVVTTSADTDDPRRGYMRGDPPYVDDSMDYVKEFAIRAFVGTHGSDKEKGLASAAAALSPELLAGHNAGFLRDEAHLLVVAVSDEEDCSDDGALDGMESSTCYTNKEFLGPVSEYVNQYVAAKHGQKDLVRFGAIITPALDDPECDSGETGNRYARARQLLGGTIGNICQADWSDMLYDLGLTATGVESTFTLSQAAIEDSIVVTVDGDEVAEDPSNGWTYDPNTTSIEFHGDSLPPRGAEITVEYEIQPGA